MGVHGVRPRVVWRCHKQLIMNLSSYSTCHFLQGVKSKKIVQNQLHPESRCAKATPVRRDAMARAQIHPAMSDFGRREGDFSDRGQGGMFGRRQADVQFDRSADLLGVVSYDFKL